MGTDRPRASHEELEATDFVNLLGDVLGPSVEQRCLSLIRFVQWRTRASCIAVATVTSRAQPATLVAHADYPEDVSSFILSPAFMADSRAFDHQMTDDKHLYSWDDVGFPDTDAAERVYGGTGFRNGVTVPLRHGEKLIGMVHANTSSARIDGDMRDILLGLRPAFTQLTSAVAEYHSARLTAREHDVLLLVRDGKTNAQIASDLVISERTVATHIERILRKLGAANRVDAAVWACRSAL